MIRVPASSRELRSLRDGETVIVTVAPDEPRDDSGFKVDMPCVGEMVGVFDRSRDYSKIEITARVNHILEIIGAALHLKHIDEATLAREQEEASRRAKEASEAERQMRTEQTRQAAEIVRLAEEAREAERKRRAEHTLRAEENRLLEATWKQRSIDGKCLECGAKLGFFAKLSGFTLCKGCIAKREM